MKYILIILLLFLPIQAFSGGDSQAIQIISLEEFQNKKYLFKYKELATGKEISVHLEFKPFRYMFIDFLSRKSFDKSISLLKKQLEAKKPCRFGSFGGGPCPIDKENNTYRSDALNIHEENHNGKMIKVVYAFCEYQ